MAIAVAEHKETPKVGYETLKDEDAFASVIARAFGQNGVVVREVARQKGTQIVPAREEQKQYAERVARAVARTENGDDGFGYGVFLEASTGVGKTLGYLVPLAIQAVLSGRQNVVTTQTLALMRQIMQRDAVIAAEAVSGLTGYKPSFARRRGVNNFASASRVARKVQELQETETPQGEIDRLQLLGQEPYETFEEWLETFGDFPAGVEAYDLSLNDSCPAVDFAAYNQEREDSRFVDVVVTNHAMLTRHIFATTPLLTHGEDNALPGSIWIDEADRLEQSLAGFHDGGAPPVAMSRRAAKIAEDPEAPAEVSKAAAAVATDLEDLREAMVEIGEEWGYRDLVLNTAPESVVDALDEAVESAAGRLDQLIKRIRKHGPDSIPSQTNEALVQVSNTAEVLRETCKTLRGDRSLETKSRIVMTWSEVRGHPNIRRVPVNVTAATKRLARHADVESGRGAALVGFTSASLLSPREAEQDHDRQLRRRDRFAMIAGKHGFSVERGDTLRDLNGIFEPKDFGRMSFAFGPAFPHPTMWLDDEEDDNVEVDDDPDWLMAVASTVQKATVGSQEPNALFPADQSALVLVNAYRTCENLAETLKAIDPGGAFTDRMVVNDTGSSFKECVETFKAKSANGEKPVFVTPTGWIGLDLPGMLDHVMITRLPFQPVDEVADRTMAGNLKRRLNLSDSAVHSILFARRIDRMARLVRQGIGRGIRQPDDDVRLWLLDPRFPVPHHVRRHFVVDDETIKRNSGIQNALKDAIPKRFRRLPVRGGNYWIAYPDGSVDQEGIFK